ncbi:Hypothetical predicted protein [Mytilus galloprovincialis]|nr:Hypothetical predicted protein [Mytilus galloprovincialis]
MDDERKDLNYIYFGCYDDYIEKLLGFRDTRTDWEDNIPPFVCMTNCHLMHRSNFFGITRGDRCICGPIFNKQNHIYHKYFFELYKENNTECDINCFGNRGEKCGGNSTISMYRILEETSSSVPTSSPTTAYAQEITSDNSNTSSSIKDGRTTEHGIAISIIAGVSVGVALLLILLLLLVLALIRHR